MTPPDSAATSGLVANNASVQYGNLLVLNGIQVECRTASITAIVGPNGCGKSTLLRALSRTVRLASGCVLLDGKSIATSPTREVAKSIGLLPQGPRIPSGITVSDLVALGRYPHQRGIRRWREDDEAAIQSALAAVNCQDLASRPVEELSGGQRQRAWLAMTLAQSVPVLLLDEPTTFLDLGHQAEILELLKRLNGENGLTVVVVLHDLNQASRYAHHIIAMSEGKVVSQGSPNNVINERTIASLFGLSVTVIPDPVFGTPLVVPGVR